MEARDVLSKPLLLPPTPEKKKRNDEGDSQAGADAESRADSDDADAESQADADAEVEVEEYCPSCDDVPDHFTRDGVLVFCGACGARVVCGARVLTSRMETE